MEAAMTADQVTRRRRLARKNGVAVMAVVATVGLLAGCGSTVPLASSANNGAAASSNGLGGSTSGTAATGPGVAGPAAAQSATSGSTSGRSGSADAFGAGSAGTAGAGSAAAGTQSSLSGSVSGPGVTATTISVGVIYTPSAGAANDSFVGGNKLDPGDPRGYWNAVIAYVNAHGGVAGRRLAPVWYNNSGGGSAQQQEQAACTYLTQDHHVFAYLALAEGADGVFQACAEKAGIVNLNTEQTGFVPQDYVRYPHFVDISDINLVRMGTVTMNGLAAQGYLKGGWNTDLAQPAPGVAKLGVMAYDLRNYHEAVDKGFSPASKAHGTQVAEVQYVSGTDLDKQTTDVQAGILKFKSEGITHVVLVDGPAVGMAGTLSILFPSAAQSANYYPRLGLNTNAAPLTTSQGGFWSDKQAQGGNAVNWFEPISCFPTCASTTNPAFNLCQKIMTEADVSITNPNAALFALTACDTVFFLKTTVVAGGATINPDTFMAAVNGLGRSYNSPFLLGSLFGRASHDGVGAVQYQAYDASCSCFKNSSGVVYVR
jgi:hypothetical protein